MGHFLNLLSLCILFLPIFSDALLALCLVLANEDKYTKTNLSSGLKVSILMFTLGLYDAEDKHLYLTLSIKVMQSPGSRETGVRRND